MILKANLAIFLVCLFSSSALGQLYYNESGSGISSELFIYFEGIEIFHHSVKSPILSVGNGTTEFIEIEGNFEINDTVDLITPLILYSVVTESEENLNIRFFDRDVIITGELTLTVEKEFLEDPKLFFEATITVPKSGYNRLWLNMTGKTTEKIFGGGEQYTYFNLQGYSFPIWTSEQGIGRGDILTGDLAGVATGDYYTTYWPSASFLSSRGFSVYFNNHEYLVLDFEDRNYNRAYVHSTSISGYFLYSETFQDLIPKMALAFGTQPMLPDWIMSGAILGLEGTDGGTNEISNIYYQAKTNGVIVSAIWLKDWTGRSEDTGDINWNWEWDPVYYEGLDSLTQDLLSEEVRMVVYINPHLSVDSDMYIEAEASSYLMVNETGSTYQQDFRGILAGTIDVFNNDARDWFKEKMFENIINLNFSGWMADYGEHAPIDMYSTGSIDMMTQEEVHNLYPTFWAQLNSEIVEASNMSDIVYFMRSGSLGSTAYQVLNWAGSQNVDFSVEDGLPSTIKAALSLAVSGMGLCSFDIGGYTTEPPLLTRSKELLMRSAEYAVFTPVMRTTLGSKPDANWQVYSDTVTLKEFGRLSQIHARLFNYTKFLVQQNYESGIPVQRPMFYHYENDEEAWDQEYQYMYGEDLIVAPVLSDGETTASIYIPTGDTDAWFHIWGGIGSNGGPFYGSATVVLPAPLGLPAVLFRNSSDFRDLFISINEDFGAAEPFN